VTGPFSDHKKVERPSRQQKGKNLSAVKLSYKFPAIRLDFNFAAISFSYLLWLHNDDDDESFTLPSLIYRFLCKFLSTVFGADCTCFGFFSWFVCTTALIGFQCTFSASMCRNLQTHRNPYVW